MTKLSPTLEAGQSVLSQQGFKEFSLLTFRVMSVGHFAPFDLEGENAHPSWRLVPTTSFHEVHEFIPMKFYVIFSLTCLIWGSNVWVRYPSWKLSPQPTLFYPYVKVLFTVYRVNNILYMHPLDQYPTFIMLWDVANLRPIHYTKCPPYSKEKWSLICCISKHNKDGLAKVSTRESNSFKVDVWAILRPLFAFRPPHGGWQKWSRILDLSKHSGDIAQTSFVALEGHYSKAMRVPLTKIAL